MKTLLPAQCIVAAAIICLMLVASGCDRYTDSGQTVGQKLNGARDKAEKKVDQVGPIVDDSAITASIKADLLKDPGLSALGIEVITVKGEVTLKGAVSTAVRKQRAAGIASHIVGVKEIINRLQVTTIP